MSSYIKKALISEKSYLSATSGKFTFLVNKEADKKSIKNKIEKLFNVNVLTVNTANYIGKIKMTKRIQGKRANFKKAFLTLKAGQKIDLFELEKTDNKKEDKKTKVEKAVNTKAKN